jgi:autotransporter translocation and assembly factor TamB
MARFRPLHLTKAALRLLVYAVAAVLVVTVVVIAAVETGWVKNQIRRVIVSQANHYLTATLDIGKLEGSLFRGLTLSNVTLSHDGQPIISIDEVSLSYSIRELFDPGTIIRSIRLTRPRVVASKTDDGRWNLAALVRREQRDQQRTGPGRPLHIRSIEVIDGDVALRDALAFGAVHVPSRFAALNASFTFDYEPVTWRIQFGNVSWRGDGESLSMDRLAGGLSNGPGGWTFDRLDIRTPRSALVVTGKVDRSTTPSTLGLHVDANRFTFQEWQGVLGGLRNIAVESSFNLTMTGPTSLLATDLTLHGTGGDIRMNVALNTAVPGWHGKGDATVSHVNLARWLNHDDRQSDITGSVAFDLDLDLGRHFPRGSYQFRGPHAAYIGYEVDDLTARGTLTATDALIADATGVAYGSHMHIVNGSIGIDAPYAYHFVGSDTGLDLTALPPQVPITHVPSVLALDTFDVTGQFAAPAFIAGGATFGDSVYLGAKLGAGTAGTIDTSTTPVRYTGEGDISDLDINHFGEGLDVAWMKDPRWAGTVSGHFRVDGAGAASATMRVDGGGHLARADMFSGRLGDAEVSVHIADGSLTGSYDGRLDGIDTSLAFADPRFAATLTGEARATFAVRDLMTRITTIDDYDISGTLDVQKSIVRGIHVETGSAEGHLAGTTLDVTRLDTRGDIDMTGSGRIEFDGSRDSDFRYQLASADLALLNGVTGVAATGTATLTGSLTGPLSQAHVAGNGSVDNLDVNGTSVVSIFGAYDATVPWDDPMSSTASIDGSAVEIYAAGRDIPAVEGTVTYEQRRVSGNLRAPSPWAGAPPELEPVTADLSGLLRPDAHAFDLSQLTLSVGRAQAWRLAEADPPATISWDDAGVTLTQIDLVDTAAGTQRISLAGSWRNDGMGAFEVTARQVYLDPFFATGGGPARYGGLLDLHATLHGTADGPAGSAEVTVTNGRVRQLPYQRLAGRADYAHGAFQVDFRLDQNPGVWLTARGTVPMNLSGKSAPAAPIDVAVESSSVGLGLLEGLTDVVHDVSGILEVNLKIGGTLDDPRFTGTVAIDDAGFVVTSSGARYKNGRIALALAADRLNVSAFHLEDRNNRTLDVSGSLGTSALRVGDIHIDAVARHFEVLHNDTGTADVDARLQLRGDLNRPRVAGDVTILAGELKVDRIFERALFQPYATKAEPGVQEQAAQAESMDALAALNPWERLGLDVSVHSPGTLRLTGDNVQVTPGTPLGLGSFNLRATGDLYVYKDPGQPAYVTGSFDSISGSYAFQGRRFDVDPTSSINFRGDLNPEIYVSVTRLISGVETRVNIAGELRQPELHLSSTPPLEASDILSLIVFNTSTSELSATQQQDLAVRAGTLAYGFVATPLISALSRSIGLETLEINPPNVVNGVAYGPSVTVGNELVPGLVAQFTRAFGQEGYDEATIEYYISRILRIRATFSDAQSLVIRDQPFRRVERAGIDLLFFFSF